MTKQQIEEARINFRYYNKLIRENIGGFALQRSYAKRAEAKQILIQYIISYGE